MAQPGFAFIADCCTISDGDKVVVNSLTKRAL